jgi:hypothetical protein
MEHEHLITKLEQNPKVAQRAMLATMEAQLASGFTKRSNSGTALLWAEPRGGRFDLSGLIFRAVGQFAEAGLLKELEQTFDPLLVEFQRRSKATRQVVAKKRQADLEHRQQLAAQREEQKRAEREAMWAQ